MHSAAPQPAASAAYTVSSASRVWRWAAAAAIVGNIGLNYVSQRYPFNGQTNAQVSYKYPTPLTPAGYAFSIWGLIFLSLLAYAVWQLLPAQRRNPLPDAVAKPLVFVNVLTGLWLVVFAYELLVPSMLVMLLILAGLALVYGRSRRLVQQGAAPWYSTVPFGLYLGWISVATVVNVTLTLGTLWQVSAATGMAIATVLVGVTTLIALGVTNRFRELAYPAAVAWGLLGIWVARKGIADAQLLAWSALGAAVLVAGAGLALSLRQTQLTAETPQTLG
ncbi:hypothetical protein GCM10027346_35460 [Hymenobacter seoulensis]